MLVNDNIAEYNVSQEKKNYPRWRCRHDKPACRLLTTSQESREHKCTGVRIFGDAKHFCPNL